jgi:hypothetical protein
MRSSKSVILFVLLLFLSTGGYSQFKNEDELKKQAAKNFDDEEYASGFKLYSQLVANYPKDPIYNYRLGVCMLFTDADKKKAIPYLQTAAKTAKNNEKEALFYLGKAYHFNYQFDEAMNYYAQYKNIASASMIKKLQVDREIQACKNGKRLLSNLEELVVLDKKQLSEGDYFRSYDLKNIGGKLLVKPDEFRSAADKKKKDKSIVYLPKSNDQLYFAGYGDKGDNKDIYIVRKLPSGDWSKPENLGAPINTEFDEDYPFLHPNGKVLYFASKGQNSMGGFDLFKSELDAATNRWKQPVNLAFPINSPNDDILFVTDSLEKIAFFASSRQSPAGKIDVFKILTEKRPAEFAFIKGTILKKDPNQSVLSKIKVKNIETGEDAGTFSAGADGSYSLKIPNGGKFIFTVETPGFPTQSEGVNIPTAYTYVPYKQAIGYETQKLYITNFFDAKADDENNYKEFLELIEQKSKMNVNADDFGVNRDNPLAVGNNTSAVNNQQSTTNNNQTKTTTEEPIANSNTVTANPAQNKNVSNKELIQMAYDDATELQQSADSLKGDAATAFSAANSKQDQATQKKQEAEQTLAKANTETDAAKKQELSAEAEKQKDEAALYEAQSSTANNIAKQLEVDATNKQQEASLNLQYANALEEAEKTKNNKQAITKLEELQKQLEIASKQKSNSNALLENIKADANNKQQELQNAEKNQGKITNDIKDITNEISSLDKQIAETKDKDLIENYTAKKQEQESDLADKKKEQETNQAKINSLKEEAETLKSQADYATSIVGGNTVTEIATNKSTENTSANQAENKTTTENNTQVANQESTNKTNQAANNVTQNNEENKKENNAAANQNQENASNNTQAVNNQTQGNQSTNNESSNNAQVNNTGPATDLINQAQNNFNDEKKVFGAVTYTDAKALQLKQQADEKFNGVLSDAKNVESQLQQINNQSSAPQINNTQQQIDDLNKQANELSAQARQLRKDAQTLTGAEKQNAQTKIAELDKQATDLLYTAAKQQLDSDKNTFTNNDQNIQNLLQRPENKANAEQARQLAEEAAILNKATQELKEEAEADPSVASRVGGLSNADEKQKSALAKQQQALKLLKGPITAGTGDVTQQLETLKNKLSQETQSSNVALKTLSDANKAEYTASIAQLNQDEKKNKVTPEVKDLQTQAQKKMQEAGAEIGKASINKNEENKRAQLLDANQKMEEAIKEIKQADQLLTGNNEQLAASSNQSPENNTQINNTEAASSNTVAATPNETQNNSTENKTNTEPVNTNTVAAVNNEVQNNQTQNANENAVTSNNETQNNQQSNNTQAQENTNAVINNTVTPNENQTAANLSPQQINEIKNTPEYKQYTTLQKETEKYNEQATKQQNQTDLYKNKAEENLKRAEQLKADAAALPDGTEKQDKLAQAEKLELSSATLKTKADSMQEIASSTRSFAESKKQEAEAYTQTLDKKTADNIEAVSTNKTGAVTSNNTAINNASNEAVSNNNTSTDKYASYSETFKTTATQYDEKLNAAQAQESSPENLREQDGIISNYIKTVEAEILQKKQEEAAATSPTQKNKITAAIKTLQSKRAALKQTLVANQKIINENKVAATNNTNSANQSQNNTTTQNNQATNTTNEVAAEASEGSTEATKYIGTKGFEIKQGNAYTTTHPIPLNEKLPDGLVFRVQIGAFKNPIALDAFKGLTPIGGETTPQGFIRYQAGLFDKYNNANAVKNDLKNLGYKDAFVVAYLNGKRVNLADALDTLKRKGEPVNTDVTSTAGITANNNVPVNTQATNVVTENAQPVQSSNLTTVNGLLFTIQIGVYTNNVSNTQLGNLKPIYREQLTNGNYRYTAGIYSSLDLVKTDRRKVNALGISDAFVSAYLNGQRIKITDAIDKVATDKTIQFPTQQPIIFPGEAAAPQPTINNPQPTNTNLAPENNTTGIQPFSNGVTESPAPTADNGVKANDEGITFKVQIGAYRKQVPQQISDTWLKVKTWPIKYVQVNDIYIYTLGSFTEARFAQKLKDEVVSLGITDAFITVFKDGKKLPAAETQKYLSR